MPINGTFTPFTLYVYGTLRPGFNPLTQVSGTLYDLGWYPGVILDDGPGFMAEAVQVTSVEMLRELDSYEGYRPNDPENSLFIRKPVLDGQIYVYNQPIERRKIVPGGDWLEYQGKKAGGAEHFFGLPPNGNSTEEMIYA